MATRLPPHWVSSLWCHCSASPSTSFCSGQVKAEFDLFPRDCIVVYEGPPAHVLSWDLQPFGTRWLATTQQERKSGHLPPKINHRRKKLTESLWKLTAYSTLLSFGIRALHNRHWTTDTQEWWQGYPNQRLEPQVELYYNAELAFYGASLLMLLVWEERRHDFAVMLTHHVVTIFLIGFSAYTRFTRIGAVVMLLHDPSDIFLELAKVCQYLGFEAAATASFAVLMITWFLLRLVIFPFWLIRSALTELPDALGAFPPYSHVLIGLLCSLVVMHVYWFALIVKVAWGTLRTGVTVDSREDED